MTGFYESFGENSPHPGLEGEYKEFIEKLCDLDFKSGIVVVDPETREATFTISMVPEVDYIINYRIPIAKTESMIGAVTIPYGINVRGEYYGLGEATLEGILEYIKDDIEKLKNDTIGF